MRIIRRAAAAVAAASAVCLGAHAAPTVQLATGDSEEDLVVTLDAYGVTTGLVAVDPNDPDRTGQTETDAANPLTATGLFIDFAGGNLRAVNDALADTDAEFTNAGEDGTIRSSFVIDGLLFEVTQTIASVGAQGELPAGAVLSQTYTITNIGASPVEFGMTRVVNPIGSNVGGLEASGGTLRPYAFGTDGRRFYLTAEGGADGGFGTLSELNDGRLFAGPRTGDAFFAEFGGGAVSGDTNGDDLSDSNRFDALAIRRTFALAAGESATFATSTFLSLNLGGSGGGGTGTTENDPFRPTSGPGSPGGPTTGGPGTPVDPNGGTGTGGGGIIVTLFPDNIFEINGRCIANCDELGVQYTLFQFIPAEFVLFERDLETGRTYFFDPPIAVGYTYEVEGAEFGSVTAPSLAAVPDPDGFTLRYRNADGELIEVQLAAGETHVFETPVTAFLVSDIAEDLAGTDFVLGISFASLVAGGQVILTQTGFGIDPNEFDAVPLPAGALLLLTGLAGGAALRRRARPPAPALAA